MNAPILIAVAAGVLSAVVFAGAAESPLVLRFTLFFLTPLPIYLAGLAYGWRCAAIAGAAAVAAIFATASPQLGLVFGATEAAPAAILVYFALLHRQVGRSTGETAVQYYPTGRIVVIAALIAALVSIGTLLLLGRDLDAMRATLRTLLEAFLKAQTVPGTSGAPLADPQHLDRLANAALHLFPAFTAVSFMGAMLFSLWLAGKILIAAKRLTRPWPDIAAVIYPRGTALAFAIATAAALFLDGYPALAASGFAGGLFFAYVLMGLAIIHYASRGRPWRGFLLWSVYVALVLVSSIIAPMLAILGLSEAFWPLRRPPPDHVDT